jgi:hypothetical protein
MKLLPEILKLWDDARGVFKQARTWERARRLGLSQLACLERHTVTGLLCTGGRQFVDWSGDYRVFSQARWDPNDLFRPVLAGALKRRPEGPRIVVALDDTVLRKSGIKTPGVAYRRDPLSPAFQVNLILAQRFIQFSFIIPHTSGFPAAARAVPCRFQHVPSVQRPKRTAGPDEWDNYREAAKQQNLNTAAVRIVQQLRDELDFVHHVAHLGLVLVVDGSYTNKTVLRQLPRNTTLIGRIRKDAKLYFPNELSPRQYGPPAPTPEELRQDDRYEWQGIQAYAAGKTRPFRIKTLASVRWRKTGTACPLRAMVIAPLGYRLSLRSRILYRQPAYLICTNPDLPVPELLQEFLWRWDIEVNHRDEKQNIGVGDAQVRSPQSVDRQPAFAVASYAILLLAANNAFGPEEIESMPPLPKWQQRSVRHRLSTQRLIQHLRYEVWGYALDQIAAVEQRNDFVTPDMLDTKWPEPILPLEPPVTYARSG